MRKLKPLPYKRGDDVIFIRLDRGIIDLTRGVVSAVRNDRGTVHVRYRSPHGWAYTTAFGREPGMFQENPRPLWHLQHLNGKNFRKLQRRIEHARKEYQAYQDAVEEMDRQLDYDARQWKSAEREKRLKLIPNRGFPYLYQVAARMGFKKPRGN